MTPSAGGWMVAKIFKSLKGLWPLNVSIKTKMMTIDSCFDWKLLETLVFINKSSQYSHCNEPRKGHDAIYYLGGKKVLLCSISSNDKTSEYKRHLSIFGCSNHIFSYYQMDTLQACEVVSNGRNFKQNELTWSTNCEKTAVLSKMFSLYTHWRRA